MEGLISGARQLRHFVLCQSTAQEDLELGAWDDMAGGSDPERHGIVLGHVSIFYPVREDKKKLGTVVDF